MKEVAEPDVVADRDVTRGELNIVALTSKDDLEIVEINVVLESGVELDAALTEVLFTSIKQIDGYMDVNKVFCCKLQKDNVVFVTKAMSPIKLSLILTKEGASRDMLPEMLLYEISKDLTVEGTEGIVPFIALFEMLKLIKFGGKINKLPLN